MEKIDIDTNVETVISPTVCVCLDGRLSDPCLRADQGDLAANAGAQIFAVEAPCAAYLMSGQLT